MSGLFEIEALRLLTRIANTGDRLVSIVSELSTAIGADADRLLTEVQEILDVVRQVRADLATAIANALSGADVAALQSGHDKLQAAIASLDAETPAPPTP
jgi:uncharacterized membrane-anchored protein